MIVAKEVTRTVVEFVTEDVLCNKCGKSCKTPIGNFEGLIEADEGIEAAVAAVRWVLS